MERKIVKKLIDNGFGFPVILENVPMIKIRGSWTPEVDYNNITRELLLLLVGRAERLTGNQIKFIRHHFSLTLKKFAERFAVSHPAVLKWEKTGDSTTDMGWSTEKDIRLFVKRKLESSAKDFYALYAKLEKVAEPKVAVIRLDLENIAA